MCIEHKDLSVYDNGQVALKGDLLSVFNSLDTRFKDIAHKYGAVEHQYPSFIQAKELNKLDYLHSFPQHVTFPVVLDDTDDNLKTFRALNQTVADAKITLSQITDVENVLTPAACYHVYIDHQGQTFDSTRVFTTKCTCYRREKYYRPLERQWNFSMREIILIGERIDVKEKLNAIRDDLHELANHMGLNTNFQTATDAFFDPSNNPKYLLQKIHPNKHELLFNYELAIASVNEHRNYFGETFEITIAGGPAFSGCVAFGIERWIFALLTQHGPTIKDWPIEF